MIDHRTRERADKARQDAADELARFEETLERVANRLEAIICNEMTEARFEPEEQTCRGGLAHLLLDLLRDAYRAPQDPDEARRDALFEYDESFDR